MLVFERLQLAKQFVEFGIGNDGRVPHVVAELVSAHLFGELLPAATQVGVGGLFSLFGQRSFRFFRAHTRRLTERPDTESPAASLAPCRTRSCSATSTSGWPKCARSAWASPRRSRRSRGAGRCFAHRRCLSCTAATPSRASRGSTSPTPTRFWSRSTNQTARP